MNRNDRRDDWALIVAVVLIAFGGVMLLRQTADVFGPLRLAFEWGSRLFWPIALILVGLLLYLSSRRVGAFGTGSPDRKLYRSRNDRMVAGVLGGLGAYMGVDPVWLRVAFAIVTLMGFGPAILLYIIGAIFIPEEPIAGVMPPSWPTSGPSGPAGPSAPTPMPPSSPGWPHTGSGTTAPPAPPADSGAGSNG